MIDVLFLPTLSSMSPGNQENKNKPHTVELLPPSCCSTIPSVETDGELGHMVQLTNLKLRISKGACG